MEFKLLFICICLSSIIILVKGTTSSFIPRTILQDATCTCSNYKCKYTATKNHHPINLVVNDGTNNGVGVHTIPYHNVLLLTRGGAYYNGNDNDDYDEYDAYDAYDEDGYDYDNIHDEPPSSSRSNSNSRRPYSHNPNHNPNQRRPPSQSQSQPPRNRQPPPRGRRGPPHPHPHRRPPPNSNRGRNQYKKPSPSSALLSTTADIAQKSLNVATSATISTLKTSGRAAYYLTAPKHVNKDELYGIWRFDQSIGSSVCAANIEFTLRGDAITRYGSDGNSNGEKENSEKVTGYLFRSKSWPRSCSIEFEAEAFQGAEDPMPVKYYYKGYFRRKMADKSVIKIVGKIYEVKKRFWKGKDGPGVAGEEVGSFVARKRLQANRDEIYSGEEYDDDDDYDYSDYDGDYGEGYDDDDYGSDYDEK